MIDVVGIAFGAVSPLGEGGAAFSPARIGAGASTAVASDPELRDAGLARTAAARCQGNAANQSLLERALAACLADLDDAFPAWRGARVGLVLGSSSGDMRGAQIAYASLARGERPSRESARRLAYGAPFRDACADVGVPLARAAHILGACASSTIACGLAQIWLSRDECDVVLAGGYDEISLLVASGFVALGAVTQSVPQPFRAARDGLAIGEAAAVVAFVRADHPLTLSRHAALVVGGLGVATDAVHITAPDREGRGLRRAIDLALSSADRVASDVDALSAHGTATFFNDAAEWSAFRGVFGEARLRELPLHAMKGETGHLFGAAGVLESLALARSLASSIALPTAGDGAIDPESPARLLDVATSFTAEFGLKTSLAFGGLNAALVVPRVARREERGHLHACSPDVAEARVDTLRPLADIARALGVAVDRLTRTDGTTRLVLDAVARLRGHLPAHAFEGAGILVGHDVANVATNALYWSRLLSRGARFAEPRRFPFTSPNACAGESAILFGLTGPAFAVGGYPGGELEAFHVARDMVSAGICRAVVVVEVSEPSAAASALLFAWDLPDREPSARARFVTANDHR